MLAQSGGFSPSPFAVALANQLQGGFHSLATHLQHLNSLAQGSALSPSLVSSKTSSNASPSSSVPLSNSSAPGSIRKPRVGGSTMKTAKVWRYFDQLPSEEQAAECQLCRKKIKATNSSTTGMIRHLRSCHVNEYQQLQEARQGALLPKTETNTEEKNRAALMKEINEKMASNGDSASKRRSPQLSPHSASDSLTSETSSGGPPRLVSPLTVYSSLLRHLPAGLPAPKPLMPGALKMEVVETEDEALIGDSAETQPTDFSLRTPSSSLSTSTATSSLLYTSSSSSSSATSLPQLISQQPVTVTSMPLTRVKSLVETIEERRVNTQVALMLLLDGQPSSVVDRQGFRGFIKMILPGHPLPPASQFDSEIIPEVISRLKADLSSSFPPNNPMEGQPLQTKEKERDAQKPETTAVEGVGGGSVEQVIAAMRAATNISRSFSHSIDIRKEEMDSDSSSSADSESGMPARIDSFLNHIGRYIFPHEELLSLLSLCRSWFAHFEEMGNAHVLLSGLSLPSRVPGRPDLARDVAFVAENLEKLNAYAAAHPEAELVLIPEHQAQFIRDLHAHISGI